MGELGFNINSKFFPEENFSIKVKRVGREHCSPFKKHEIRKSWYYHSMHLVTHGHGVLSINGKQVEFKRGTVFLLYAFEEYEYYPDSNDPWLYIWIDFEGENLDELLALCGFSKEKPYINFKNHLEIVDLFKQILSAYDMRNLWQLACSAQFMLIIDAMLKNKMQTTIGGNSSARYMRFCNILFYINSNFRMDLSLENLSEATFLSPNKILALFSEFLGMTPANYIGKFRVSSACDLLRETDETIASIATMVGIRDEKYFMRLFKKWKGVTPKEYRQSGNNEDAFDWLKEHDIDFR